MIKSMTGYGRAAVSAGGREITVEVRSVNNRYLDCNVKLPRMFAFAEDLVKQKVKESISRGKVDVYISVAQAGGEAVSVNLNRPVLEGYLSAMRTMASEYHVEDNLSVEILSRLPDVFVLTKEEETRKRPANRFCLQWRRPSKLITRCGKKRDRPWSRI